MCFKHSIWDFFFCYSSTKCVSFFVRILLKFCLQVDVVTSSGEVPVSVCTYKQPHDQDHWILLIESVERVPACLTFSQDVGQTVTNFLFVCCYSF